MEKVITKQAIETFRIWLEKAGKGIATIQKYLRDLKKLECFLAGNQIDKKQMLAYKKKFWDCGKYKISSINSFLVAANRFLKFMGWYEMIVETYPVQEEIVRSDEKVLIEEECKKLIDLQRKQVWRKKVFPHNFRHLFAHYFYRICKDIVKVVALLGHRNIKTTLNYLKTTKQECREMLDQMK